MGTSAIILLVVIVGAVLWAISVYNGLVSMRQRVNQAFADVDVQLRQRHDLVPNLVETVKGYAAHERGTLDEVIAKQTSFPEAVSAGKIKLSGNPMRLAELMALMDEFPRMFEIVEPKRAAVS